MPPAENTPGSGQNIVVFGLGYVGCVTAACFASLGHKVTGVDRDSFKVDAVCEGRAPFHEPGLEELVAKSAANGCLSATTDIAAALASADVAFLCVGTPSERSGNLDTQQLKTVCEDISKLLPAGKKLIVAVRSTVFPGTCEQVVIPAFATNPTITVVSNPEFLREGTAIKDFTDPSLLVVGSIDPQSAQAVADLYRDLSPDACIVSLRTAEMIKYACNAFHAVKIAFANEIGSLCDRVDVDGREVMATLCRDVRLNVSPAYLKPGFAFGGSCLPKDLRALNYRASRMDLRLPLLSSALPSNEEHLERAIDRVLALPAKRIGIYGLAFKEDTDDLRESPVVTLLEHLIGKGKDVRVFDPHINVDAIYGSNRNFILNAIPHIGRLMVGNLNALVTWSDHIVVTQPPAAAVSQEFQRAALPVINLSFPAPAPQRSAVAE